MKIQTRIALLTTFLIVALALSVIEGQDVLLRDHLFASQKKWVDTLVRTVAEEVAQDTIDGERLDARALLRRIVSKNQTLAYMYVTDFEGRLFAHTFDGGLPKVLARHLYTAGHSETALYATERGNINEVTAPLIEGMVAHLHIGVNQKEIDALFAEARADLILIVLVAAVVSLGIALVIGSRMSRPLRMLSDQIRRYGETGKGVYVDVSTTEPDIKGLANVFNEMVASRSQTEAGLRESEAQFRHAETMAHLCHWLADDSFSNWTYVSQNTETLFGVPCDELLGPRSKFLAFVHLDDRDPVCQAYSKVAGNPKRYELNYRIVRGDGKIRHFYEVGEPEMDANGGVILFRGTTQDITESKQAEEQLRQAHKMEAVGQLTAGVAHDFNNMLAVVWGNAELLEDELGADNPRLAAVFRATKRAADLTQRLLAFSRKQVLNPKIVNANHLIADITGLLRRTLEEHIDIEAVTAAGLWNCEVDPAQLENALVNLAINARDAMPDGGKLTIETANARLDDDYAAAQAEVMPGQYVMLAVTDTGSGMPPEVREHVFEPFFTTKGAGKGTGLGLSMIYGFVKQSGGHVMIYSEEGEGTTVKLYLPRSTETETVERKPVTDEVPAARGETVLVVEDDPEVRTLVVTLLGNLGYQIMEAGTGSAALEQLGTTSRVNLLLTDVVLPGGMNGRELATEVARRAPGIRVLYMSGYTENAILHHGRLDADAALLQKPFRRADLARAVRAALDGPSA